MTIQTSSIQAARTTAAPTTAAGATLLVDKSLRVLAAPAGADLEGMGLRIAFGVLCTGSAVLNDRLRTLIATGLASSLEIADGVATVAISPIVAIDPSLGGSLSVVMVTPNQTDDSKIERVRTSCGLTGSETEVLRLIFKGLSTVEVAGVLGIARTTVRTHLQHIFEKTETSRQSELVHFVATSH